LLALALAAVPRATPVPSLGCLPEGRGPLGLQHPRDEPFGELPAQARLAQARLGGGRIFQEFIAQGIVVRGVPGPLSLLRLVASDNQLHSSLYTPEG
jgi:hypothetical protein